MIEAMLTVRGDRDAEITAHRLYVAGEILPKALYERLLHAVNRERQRLGLHPYNVHQIQLSTDTAPRHPGSVNFPSLDVYLDSGDWADARQLRNDTLQLVIEALESVNGHPFDTVNVIVYGAYTCFIAYNLQTRTLLSTWDSREDNPVYEEDNPPF